MTQCLTDAQLADTVSGNLTDSEQSIVEQHLSICFDCQSRLMAFVGESELGDAASNLGKKSVISRVKTALYRESRVIAFAVPHHRHPSMCSRAKFIRAEFI